MNALDPENAIVKLCVAGVQAEQAGDGERAAGLYRQAWEAQGCPLEASVAAHYLARVQPDEVARQQWNRAALEHALAAGGSAASFLPSLYLNVGHSHEVAGEILEAAAWYERAAAALETLDEGLAASLRGAVRRARQRVDGGARQRNSGRAR